MIWRSKVPDVWWLSASIVHVVVYEKAKEHEHSILNNIHFRYVGVYCGVHACWPCFIQCLHYNNVSFCRVRVEVEYNLLQGEGFGELSKGLSKTWQGWSTLDTMIIWPLTMNQQLSLGNHTSANCKKRQIVRVWLFRIQSLKELAGGKHLQTLSDTLTGHWTDSSVV